ncbi:hypothetical protein DASC09_036890 [Saccharomycopsis crataegensis]|uniref:SH3 domain-containing protein n=1 Tax=Saccharomycopsis crataegensis TaxID=43959 RepID=A0AAV5QNW6_9ASCO|nr:hypothetical protein DASC09_036890 [Saccharomycopsis crataegensis]
MAAKFKEFTSEHLKNIHKPDIDLTDVKRTVVRAPQIISKKANIGSHTVDIEFDELYKKLIDTENRLNQLVRETSVNVKSHKSFLNHCQEIAKDCLAILQASIDEAKDENEDGTQNEYAPFQTAEEIERFEYEASKREIIEKYLQTTTDMSPAIILELQQLEEKLTKTVHEILNMIKKIKKNSKERELDLLDIDKHQKSLDKLSSKPELTAKNEEHKLTLEHKLEAATEKYTRLNETMKRELPYFFLMISQIMTPLTDIIFWSFDVVSYQYFQTVNLMKSDYGITQDKFNLGECEEVVNDFYAKVRPVNQEIQKLSIINYSKSYLQDLTNSDTPPIDSLDISERSFDLYESGTAIDKYKVLFDFKPEQENDLALSKGEEIMVLNKTDNNWWKCRNSEGEIGMIPANYVERI